MLVLSRKCGEAVVLPGHGIRFTILEVKGSLVRIGVSAPAAVAVHREEVWDRIRLGVVEPASSARRARRRRSALSSP